MCTVGGGVAWRIPPPPPNPGHMGDLTFIKSNAPAQLARLGQMTFLDPVLF